MDERYSVEEKRSASVQGNENQLDSTDIHSVFGNIKTIRQGPSFLYDKKKNVPFPLNRSFFNATIYVTLFLIIFSVGRNSG